MEGFVPAGTSVVADTVVVAGESDVVADTVVVAGESDVVVDTVVVAGESDVVVDTVVVVLIESGAVLMVIGVDVMGATAGWSDEQAATVTSATTTRTVVVWISPSDFRGENCALVTSPRYRPMRVVDQAPAIRTTAPATCQPPSISSRTKTPRSEATTGIR